MLPFTLLRLERLRRVYLCGQEVMTLYLFFRATCQAGYILGRREFWSVDECLGPERDSGGARAEAATKISLSRGGKLCGPKSLIMAVPTDNGARETRYGLAPIKISHAGYCSAGASPVGLPLLTAWWIHDRRGRRPCTSGSVDRFATVRVCELFFLVRRRI